MRDSRERSASATTGRSGVAAPPADDWALEALPKLVRWRRAARLASGLLDAWCVRNWLEAAAEDAGERPTAGVLAGRGVAAGGAMLEERALDEGAVAFSGFLAGVF